MKLAPHLRNLMGVLAMSVVMGGGIAPSTSRAATPAFRDKWDNSTPEINEVVERMRQRHQDLLKSALDNQVVAVTTSGWLNAHPEVLVELPSDDRIVLERAIQEDNKDRKILQKMVAQAHGRPESEDALRFHFAEEWLKAAEHSQWKVFNPKFNSFMVLGALHSTAGH